MTPRGPSYCTSSLRAESDIDTNRNIDLADSSVTFHNRWDGPATSCVLSDSGTPTDQHGVQIAKWLWESAHKEASAGTTNAVDPGNSSSQTAAARPVQPALHISDLPRCCCCRGAAAHACGGAESSCGRGRPRRQRRSSRRGAAAVPATSRPAPRCCQSADGAACGRASEAHTAAHCCCCGEARHATRGGAEHDAPFSPAASCMCDSISLRGFMFAGGSCCSAVARGGKTPFSA
eukprot:TRINITY_DN16880_c0_g1_i1.p1 TRINITY_DN16880_c0_g1~~TRINITY_DN16880_c0_g1_i1.p1  ORF type:complete len:234 (-),score=16.85 TRINITY_DN16880_c0_g1_i1:444-1145(-)